MGTRGFVYLSGPISLNGTLPSADIERNVVAFRAEALRLEEEGWNVLDPTKLQMPTGTPWEEYMKLCLPMMCQADVIGLMPRWHGDRVWTASRGAMLEAYVASVLLIPTVAVHLL